MPDAHHQVQRRSWLAVFGVTALCVFPLLFFFSPVFEDRAFYLLDITWFHYPSRVFARRMVMDGEWPLWNPHIMCGFPAHAEGQISTFYPLSAVFLLPVPVWRVLSWFIAGHFAFAALGSYAFARALGISPIGGAIAALAFAFGGYAIPQVPHVNILVGLAWLPWLMLAARRTVRSPTWGGAATLAAILGVQTLGSHPQVSFFTVVLVPVYACFEVWQIRHQGRTAARLATSIVAPLLLAGGVAAIQILPTLELKAYSPREGGLDYKALVDRSLPPRDLLTFVSPHLFGTPLAGYMGEYAYFQFGYIGALPLLLALVAGVKARRGPSAFFAVVSAAMVLLALGGHTPTYRLLAAVPGFNWFRAPERWLGPLGLSLGLLAGFGWDGVVGAGRRAARPAAITATAVAALCLAAAIWGRQAEPLLRRYALGTMEEAWNGNVPGFMLDRIIHGATRSAAISAACWAAAAAICLTLAKGARPAPVAVAAILLCAADLFAFGSALTATASPTHLTRRSKVVSRLRGGTGLYRICPPHRGHVVAFLRENVPCLHGLFSVKGHLGQIAPTRSVRLARAVPETASILDVMGVRYSTGAAGGQQHLFAATSRSVELTENPDVWGRCYVAATVSDSLTGEEVFRRMEAGRIARHEALLERPGGWQGSAGQARMVKYRPHTCKIDAAMGSDGLVVLSDTWQPGWRAYVGGRRSPVIPANYVFRAVPVPQGRHALQFAYAPRSFGLGVLLGLMTLGAMVAATVGRTVRRGTSN